MKKFMKKALSIIICVCMIIPTTIPAGITAQAASAESISKDIAKYAIHFGIKKIPYVGSAVDSLFGSIIDDSLGLSTKKISLDDVSEQVEKLSVKMDENHNQLLTKMYQSQLDDYYKKITRIKAQTANYYEQLAEIEKDFDVNSKEDYDKKLEAIRIASVLNNNASNFGEFVDNLGEVYLYISGEAVGMDEGILDMIYKAYCNDAVLGGEAGYLAQDNIQDIVTCIQDGYLIASTILSAGRYVGDNYSAYSDLNDEDKNGNFRNFGVFKENMANYSGSLNKLNRNYGKLFGGSLVDDKKNYQCAEAELDSIITQGAVGNYNNMLAKNKFCYIEKCDYSKTPVAISYIHLDKELSFVYATDYGYQKTSPGYSAGKSTAEQYKKEADKNIHNDISKKLLEHIANNELFGTDEGSSVTLEQALKNYGFSFEVCDKHAKSLNLGSNVKKVFATKINFDKQESDIIDRDGGSTSSTRMVSLDTLGPDMNASANSALNKFNDSTRVFYYWWHSGGFDTKYEANYDDVVAINFRTYDEINNEKEFLQFIKNVANGNNYSAKHIELTADLDLAKYDLMDYWTDSNFKKEFCGSFNGGNHTIKNITISSAEHRVALLRTTGEGAVIKNLNLENVNISGTANKNGYAALVGYANGNITIDNVNIKSGNITGYKYVAGMIGESNRGKKMTITNCTNNATITSTDTDAAGMIANSGEIYISNCVNNGTITAGKGAAGGISGYLGNRDKDPYYYVEKCKNTANITGDDCSAGICANLESDKADTKIIGNENTGAIKNNSKRSAGGIVGRTYAGGLFKDNKNSGNVENLATSNGEAGGILGYNQDDYIKIENNSNSGNITAVTTTGGIAGWLGDRDHDKQCDIINNSNSGKIKSSSSDAGGIVGAISTDNTKHQVADNYNSGSVSAERQAGGIVGYMAGGGMFELNKNRSNVTSNSQNAGGLVGAIQDDLCEFKKSDVDATAVVGNPRMIDDYNYLVKAKTTGMHAGKICGWDGKRKSNIANDTLSGSIFGEGNVVIIASMAGLIIIGAGVFVIVSKKKKKLEQQKN